MDSLTPARPASGLRFHQIPFAISQTAQVVQFVSKFFDFDTSP